MPEQMIFSKTFTRDFSIIMEEAWYHALSKGLWELLGQQHPANEMWPNIFYLSKGVIEVWDNEEYMDKINRAIRTKNNDHTFFGSLIDTYKHLVEQLKDETLEDEAYINILYEAISLFSIIWFGHLDEKTDETLRSAFIDIRDTDTIYDTHDKIVRKRLLKKYPEIAGFETVILKNEFLTEIPDLHVLKERYKNFVVVPGQVNLITTLDDFAQKNGIHLQKITIANKDEVQGVCANPGMAKGKVRIIRRKSEIDRLQPGEILVSPMTTPDVFPVMTKAAAIVTDEGGLTCHAAIVSRELGKPCVIRTFVASEIFKDGDEVEVDATNGVVRRTNH